MIKLSAAVVCVAVMIVAVVYWASSLYVTGRTFSPDDFNVREFSYVRSNLFSSKANSKQETAVTTLSMSLRSSNLIAFKAPKTFHLVSDNKTDPLSRDTQAVILVNYLKMNNDFWADWNQTNPKLAKVLWHTIQAMAYDRLYILTPQVFDIAMLSSDKKQSPESFEERIRAAISSELNKMIAERSADSPSEAHSLKRLKEKYQPDAGPISLDPVEPQTGQ